MKLEMTIPRFNDAGNETDLVSVVIEATRKEVVQISHLLCQDVMIVAYPEFCFEEEERIREARG